MWEDCFVMSFVLSCAVTDSLFEKGNAVRKMTDPLQGMRLLLHPVFVMKDSKEGEKCSGVYQLIHSLHQV